MSAKPDMQSVSLDRELLRQLQKKGLDLLLYFKDICDRNGLLFYFCGGCCIGALRHGGFIPWDDDVDVFMPREDYEKLVRIWNEAADTSRYSYQRSSETVNTRNLFATVHDNSTTFIKTYQADMDINHGLSIDILPLDGCPASGLKRKMQKLWALTYSLFLIQKPPTNHGKAVQWLGKILLGLVPSKRLRYKIWSAAERRMTKYPISQCEYITELCSGPHYMQNRYPADCFAAAVYREFEGHMLPLPQGYDTYLKIAFGDYMTPPPPEKQAAHHDVSFVDLDHSYLDYKHIRYACDRERKR